VIEHIDGLPIDHYCDEHRLDIAARLRLFLEVCQAVQSAHRNLLVHRDLKPSNILVTREGRTMLLDFGIAKLLDPALIAGEVLETRTGSRPMTPGYASPEQVKGEKITTASDVYSLGVLLYELLTGRRPYRITSALPHELEKAICEDEPEKPSTAVFRDTSRNGAGGSHEKWLPPQEIAVLRGTTAAALSRSLRGDLDTLLKVVLRKDPEQRYPSVEALAQDIHAFLEGKPLKARAPSRLYNLRKFASRHRFGVATAATLLLLFLSFLTVLMLQAKQILAERDKAEKTLAFLIEVFKASDPSRAQGEELKAREILDGASRRIEKELASQPEIQATLMDAMGQVYLGLGLYHDAKSLCEKAFALQLLELGPEDPATLTTQLHLASAHFETEDFPKAKELFEEVIQRQRKKGRRDATLAHALMGLGEALRALGQDEAALASKLESLRVLEENNESGPELATAEVSLSLSYVGAQQFGQARKLLQSAEKRRRQFYGEQSLELAEVLFRRGELERLDSHYALAKELFEKTLEIERPLLDAEHPGLLASLKNLAICLSYLGQSSRSIPIYEEILEKEARRLGENHSQVADTSNLLAAVYALDGRFELALELSEKSLAIYRKLYGDEHILVANAYGNRGNYLRLLDRLDEAAASCRKAIVISAGFDPNDVRASRGQVCLGEVELARHRYEAAEALLRPVYEARKARLPAGAEALINAEVTYGCALSGLGRNTEAEVVLRSAYASLIARNRTSARAFYTLTCLVPVLKALGRPALAQAEHFLARSGELGPLDP